jgi:hypothetical protein
MSNADRRLPDGGRLFHCAACGTRAAIFALIGAWVLLAAFHLV